jgi:hypothetical protein
MVKEGAAHEIQRLQRALYQAEIENERLLNALKEIAAGKIREDQGDSSTAARLCAVARLAIRGCDNGP